jgi:hypothetical protein
MSALEILGRVFLFFTCTTAWVHFHVMASNANNTPIYLKYITYTATTSAALGGVVCALIPGPEALNVALWFAVITLAGALVVYLSVWDAGVKVCDVMDLRHIYKAHADMKTKVDRSVKEGLVAAEYLTPSTFDAYHEMVEKDRR